MNSNKSIWWLHTVFLLLISGTQGRAIGEDDLSKKEPAADVEAYRRFREVDKFLQRYQWVDQMKAKMLQYRKDFNDLAIGMLGSREICHTCNEFGILANVIEERCYALADVLQLRELMKDKGDRETATRLLKSRILRYLGQMEVNIKAVTLNLPDVKKPALATTLDKFRDDLRAFDSFLKDLDKEVN